MNRNININKVKEYANNVANLYDDVDIEHFNKWFDVTINSIIMDNVDMLIAKGLVDCYVNDML